MLKEFYDSIILIVVKVTYNRPIASLQVGLMVNVYYGRKEILQRRISYSKLKTCYLCFLHVDI